MQTQSGSAHLSQLSLEAAHSAEDDGRGRTAHAEITKVDHSGGSVQAAANGSGGGRRGGEEHASQGGERVRANRPQHRHVEGGVCDLDDDLESLVEGRAFEAHRTGRAGVAATSGHCRHAHARRQPQAVRRRREMQALWLLTRDGTDLEGPERVEAAERERRDLHAPVEQRCVPDAGTCHPAAAHHPRNLWSAVEAAVEAAALAVVLLGFATTER